MARQLQTTLTKMPPAARVYLRLYAESQRVIDHFDPVAHPENEKIVVACMNSAQRAMERFLNELRATSKTGRPGSADRLRAAYNQAKAS